MLWLLFKSFFLIGALGFGGGYAMLSLIQKEVVTKHAWLTMLQFADILAVAEMTPGPVAINTATYVGYQTAGIVGAAVATCGVVLPSFLLISILTGLLLQNKNSPYFKGPFSVCDRSWCPHRRRCFAFKPGCNGKSLRFLIVSVCFRAELMDKLHRSSSSWARACFPSYFQYFKRSRAST